MDWHPQCLQGFTAYTFDQSYTAQQKENKNHSDLCIQGRLDFTHPIHTHTNDIHLSKLLQPINPTHFRIVGIERAHTRTHVTHTYA